MNDLFNSRKIWIFTIAIFLIGVLVGCGLSLGQKQSNIIQSEQFSGAVPMKVYQIYDRDTGVYYAVTEKGGICVMYTMNGEVKLVDQGDGAIHHPNKGVINEN